MSRKNYTSLLGVLVLLVTLLSACGAPQATPEPVVITQVVTAEPEQVVVTQVVEVTPVPTPAAEIPKPKGKITLWGWSFGVLFDSGLVDEFKAEYPDIEVEWVNYATNDTYQNLKLALSAGGGPDVAQIESSHLPGFIELGGLADMTHLVLPYKDKMNAYKWTYATKDGKIYAMPWDSGPVVLFYRRDIFEAAGLPSDPETVEELVSTWDKFFEVCKTIYEKTGSPCFAQNKAQNYGRMYESVLWQQGLGYYNEKGEITVNAPGNVATLEMFGKFWDAGIVSDELEWTEGWINAFGDAEKPLATHLEACWMGNGLKLWLAKDQDSKWGAVLMPAMKEGQPRAANSGGSNMVILEESQNKDAAWAFIEFMLGRERSQLMQLAYADFFPALETTYNDPLFVQPDPFYGGQRIREVYRRAALQIPVAYIYGPYKELMSGHVATAIQKYATGQMSAQDALNEAAEAISAETGMPIAKY